MTGVATAGEVSLYGRAISYRVMRGRLRRVGSVGLERISDHPLKAAGAIAVVVGTAVIVLGVLGQVDTSISNATEAKIALGTLVQFSLERPAYPIAVLAGIAVLLRR